jgi:assimilatory nitrate reductase catalytic subunit
MLWMRGVLYQADQLRLLRSLLNEHSTYWCALPGSAGVLFESACGASEAADLFAALTNQFKQANWSSFRSGSAEKRMLLLDGQEPLMALCQSSQRSALPVFAQIVAGSVHGVGDTAQSDTPDSRWRALAYSAQAVDTSMQICSCFEVSQSQISQSLADGVTTVEGLGSALKCGTNCGSCVPELKRLIQDYGGFKAEKDTQQEREKDNAIAVGAIAPT